MLWLANHHGAATENPIADVKLASPDPERVFVFTPAQTAILLQNADERLRPYLALCCFAGLRPEQAQGLWWNYITLTAALMARSRCPKARTKRAESASCRSSPICALGSWQCRKPNVMARFNFSRRFRRKAYVALREADPSLPEEWPQDAPRHGYGTYRLKVIGSFGKVADEMGNSSKSFAQTTIAVCLLLLLRFTGTFIQPKQPQRERLPIILEEKTPKESLI